MRRAELHVVGGKHHGRTIRLGQGKFLVGREEDCQLRPNNELVSRHHCLFNLDDFSLRLRDLGSTNGTIVNGDRIRGEVLLQNGDRVQIGRLDLQVVMPSEAETATDAPQPTFSDPLGIGGDTAELVSGDTEFEIPVAPAETTGESADTGDTTVLAPGMVPQYPAEQPTAEAAHQNAHYQQPPPDQYAQVPGYAPQHAAPGYQYPGPPAGQPGGYQQPPPGYQWPAPQQGYPGQPPVPYPPQQQQQAPAQQQPPQQAGGGQPGQQVSNVPAPPVRLPDPSMTGAASEPPKPAESTEEKPQQPASSDTEMPSNTAADIIRNYMHRRPGS